MISCLFKTVLMKCTLKIQVIDKILVRQQTKVDGKKYQQIDIYYLGVGIISVSVNEYDFEKEFQNILKNKRKTA